MTSLYPAIEPADHGMLDVGGDQRIYWEACGNPDGKPAVVLHGGPGSGCTRWHRRMFDPARYRIVLFDQRGCKRSEPHAGQPDIDLSTNTTPHLIADMERLRERLGIDRWLIWGGSWGSTLALAYAESHPDRVTEMILWGVTTGRRSEADWWFRGGVAPLFPVQWERLCAGVPETLRHEDIVDAYAKLLFDADPEVRGRAAVDWCTWESAAREWPVTDRLDDRYRDPAFALAFARLVTHYVRHDDFLEDGVLLRDIHLLTGIPGVLVNGLADLGAPIGNAWTLHQAWPTTELVVVPDAGHAGDDPGIASELVRASDRFASTGQPT